MVRLVRNDRGIIVADPTGRAPGRGAYLHPDPACAELARKRRGLERALRGGVDPEVWGIIRSSGR
ncbi:MAG: YlxR family protein [Chloroflexi bacterium]|nr:MAG: YlxR family protein [Chloroflexota bacterium]TME19323.1 MAG: YlxR family protein [Chloroflexota bacterium]